MSRESSKKDGLKDGERGREDPIRSFFDEDYRKGIDIGKGIRKGEESRREIDKHPIAQPIIDALGGEALDKMDLSEGGERAYNRVKGGESPARVFGEELKRGSESDLEEEVDDYEDYGGTDGFYGDDSRSYKTYEPTWDEMGVVEKIGTVIINGIVGIIATAFYVVILAPFIIGGYYGVSNYFENKKLEPKLKVAQEYNLSRRDLAEKTNWKSGLTKRSKPYGLEVVLNSYLKDRDDFVDVRDGLVDLANVIREGGGRCAIYDYYQTGDNIWVVGRYSNKGGGFICYSPDNGETWFRQWDSYIRERGGCSYDVPVGICFFDQNEGWSITMRRIVHTLDGGRNWKTVYVAEYGLLKQFYILDRNNLIAKEIVCGKREVTIGGRRPEVPELWNMVSKIHNKKIPYDQTVYTTNGGRNWHTKDGWEPEIFGLDKLPKYSKTNGFYICRKE